MKKIIATFISAACLVMSCTPQETNDIFDVPQEGYTLFEADFEDLVIAGTSAEMIWEKGIGIGVYGSSEGNNVRYILKNASDGKAVGEYYGPEVSGESISAYYPYSEDYALFDGKMMYSLSNQQVFDGQTTVLEQFIRYAGCAYAFREDGNRLNFRYASGVMSVEVRLSKSEAVRSISLVSSAPLAGTGKVDSDMTVTLSESASKSIVLDCAEGVVSKEGDVHTKFPIVMPAGTYSDVSLVLTLADGTSIVSEIGTVEIERVTASGQEVKEMIISTGGLGGFEVEGGLEFEPQS